MNHSPHTQVNNSVNTNRSPGLVFGGLPSQAIVEFKRLYFSRYHKQLSDQEAVVLALKFLRFVKTVQSGEVPHD